VIACRIGGDEGGIESDPRGSNLEAIFVGSVRFEVVRKVHCPVAIVH
jgi:nucleotide-binding universal stress UspA family protein